MSMNDHQSNALPPADGTSPSRPLDPLQFLSHLLHLRQALMLQPHAVVEAICHEIAFASRGQAQLRVYSKYGRLTRVPSSWMSFSVEIDGLEYGKLSFAPDAAQPDRPVVPVLVAQVAADICALFISRIELAILNRGSYRAGNVSDTPTLTPREKEVLKVLCQGYDLPAIANILHIAPTTVKQYYRSICAKLDARNEREVVFAAFASGLYFPVEGLTPHVIL